MAKFLSTTGVSYALDQIIKNAEGRLILISPFLQISNRFKEMLEYQDRLKFVDIRIIYGKSELQPQESNWLKSLTSVKISVCKNLHAKCYLNEKEALITSMNFYEFSQVNNYEMGILVVKTEDPQLYNEIYKEANSLLTMSNYESYSTLVKPVLKEESYKNIKSNIEGFCIRCGTRIKMDVEHPYCLKDYQSWKKYSDKTYQEKSGVCHICGKPNKSSMDKPVCINCYKQNRNLFDN